MASRRRTLVAAIAGAVLWAAPAAAAAPPAALFQQGYDLCKAAPLAALRTAGGQRYRAGVLRNAVCMWQRADLRAGVTLSTHPPQIGAQLMQMYLQHANGATAKRVAVPGAAKAVLVTSTSPGASQPSKLLFAAYAAGTVEIGMTAPRGVADARLLAVLRVLAG